ncbi:MAG: 2-oxoacid:acceptor oxidoreductase family protein, partial [Bilophila sp.]
MNQRIRIYMTGVGGQGTLTATTLLARVAVAQGVEVVAGEIHGMAQRGGVVESTVLLGGWKSPKLGAGEADIVLGFEPLETLRGLSYLKSGGKVFSSTDAIPTPGVSAGRETLPTLEAVQNIVRKSASEAWFFP